MLMPSVAQKPQGNAVGSVHKENLTNLRGGGGGGDSQCSRLLQYTNLKVVL